jgi:hypothetical protein
MSRSGYVEDYNENGHGNLYRGAVSRALRGKRGQAFLREMARALDAMPVKELIKESVVRDGQVCAIGAVAVSRRIDVSHIDAEDCGSLADVFGIATAMVREIAFENEEAWRNETPAARWIRMRRWVDSELLPGGDDGGTHPQEE